VGHLQHLRTKVRAARHERRLGRELHVPGQQDPARRGGRADDDRRVVDRGAVLAVRGGGSRGRSEDVELEGRPAEPAPRGELDQTGPRGPRLPRDPADQALRLVGGPERDPADRPAAQRTRQPADVVRVQMGEDHERQGLHPEPAQAGVHGALLGPGVHHDRPTRLAGREDQCVSLPDVTGHRRPRLRRPSRADEPGGHEHESQADQDRQHDPARPPEPERDDERDQEPEQRDRADESGGPRQHPARDRRRPVPDQHQPADRRACRPGARRRHGRARRRHDRGRHPEDRRRCHRRHDEQVRQDPDQADLPAQPGDQRRRAERGGSGDREQLRESERDAAAVQRRRPSRSDQHQRRCGHDRQREAEVHRQGGVHHQEDENRRRERGDRAAPPTERQRQEDHQAHHRRPHDARRGPGEHHEPDDGERRGRGREPRVHPQKPEQPEHGRTDDRQVGARDGGEVGQARRAEVLLDLGRLGAGVADRETGQEARRRGGEDPRRGAQARPQRAGRGLPPGGGPDRGGRAADLQHRDREIRALCGGEEALRGHLLPGEQVPPARLRHEQQDPSAAAPLARARHGGLQLGGHGQPRLPGDRAAHRPGIVREDHPKGRRGPVLRGGSQRMSLHLPRRHRRGQADREGAPGRGQDRRPDPAGRPQAHEDQEHRRAGAAGDPRSRPTEQGREDGRPRRQRRRDQPEVRAGPRLLLRTAPASARHGGEDAPHVRAVAARRPEPAAPRRTA
jgi:hypothetical protein